jgi:hypothetical protein
MKTYAYFAQVQCENVTYLNYEPAVPGAVPF